MYAVYQFQLISCLALLHRMVENNDNMCVPPQNDAHTTTGQGMPLMWNPYFWWPNGYDLLSGSNIHFSTSSLTTPIFSHPHNEACGLEIGGHGIISLV